MYSPEYFCLPCVTCCPTSLQHLVSLFARLANDNIGYIDWDPYIPKVCCPLFLNNPFPFHSLVLGCFEVCGSCLSCAAWPFGFWLMVCISFPLLLDRETDYQVSLLILLSVTDEEVTCIMFVVQQSDLRCFLTTPPSVTDKHKHALLTC